MANSTANIIIKNNIIDSGASVSSGTPTLSRYDHCAWIRGSAIINGNIFARPNTNADILNITDGDCIIINNKFIRSNIVISSYIRHHSTSYLGIHQITDNYFDQSNIDGYTTQLVKNLNIGTTYTHNKNQICITYIPLFHDTIGAVDTTGPFYGGVTEGIDLGATGSPYLVQIRRAKENSNRANLITSLSGESGGLYLRRSFFPVEYIAPGVYIQNIRIGAFIVDGAITDYSDNYFRVKLKVHEPTDSMDATNYGVTAPDLIANFSKEIASSGDLIDLKATTIYNDEAGFGGSAIDGNYSGFIQPDYFSTSNGYIQELLFEVGIAFDAEYTMHFTPIEITYKW